MYSNHWNYSDYIKANKSSIHNKGSVLKSKIVGYTYNDQHVYVKEMSNIVRIDIDNLTVYRKKDLKYETQEWFTWPSFIIL